MAYKQTAHYQAIHEKNERDGYVGEQMALPILNDYFNASFQKSTHKYALWDFIDTKRKIVIELKTRRDINSNTYQDLLIGYNKFGGMEMFLHHGYTCYFIWILGDGMFKWEVPKALGDDVKVEIQPQKIRGDPPRPCIFIPNKQLIKMEI